LSSVAIGYFTIRLSGGWCETRLLGHWQTAWA
jgi:hypothetical protein